MEPVLMGILSAVFTAGFTVAAVKIELRWIKYILDDHSKKHENHFDEIDNIKEKIRYVKR